MDGGEVALGIQLCRMGGMLSPYGLSQYSTSSSAASLAPGPFDGRV
jgi:hypothetical protein